MRLFIAIDIPKKIKKEIAKTQDKLPEFEGKKTEIENLHLTLKFLGEVDEKLVEKIKSKLQEVKFKKFEAEISELGVFRENFIKIVWLKIDNCLELQKEIDEKLKILFPREERFMGHLTIARVKNCDKTIFLENLKKIKTKKMKFVVENFRLKKSDLTKEKPVYEDLVEVKLI
ncbi:MAG: RNA 2',3'-cyclic phosphodiesterase [Candidatus Pacearchaeota archaeon]|nr:RNA 2',3'-cyclic phosphodiesterase [Candidatus Pacearchaeota archaeon]